MDTPEKWRDIPGYEGYYQVSNHGRVKALARVVDKYSVRPGTRGASKTQFCPEHVLQPSTRSIYPMVNLYRNKQPTTYTIHTLVLLAFVGEPSPGHQACHNDGNPLNNTLTNLRWDTLSNNQLDRRRHGTAFQGEKHPNAKLNDAEARAIVADPRGCVTIAREYHISTTTVVLLRQRKIWKHLWNNMSPDKSIPSES